MKGGDMRWTEKLNIGTGFLLVIAGIINFLENAYMPGFSWLIFGSMYLVMDSYKPAKDEAGAGFAQNAALIRKIFSVIGFAAATALIIYTVTQ